MAGKDIIPNDTTQRNTKKKTDKKKNKNFWERDETKLPLKRGLKLYFWEGINDGLLNREEYLKPSRQKQSIKKK